jgi:cytochrome P450
MAMGDAIRLSDLAIDPYPILRRLQAEEPVSWVGEVGMWFVTRYDDVLRVLRDPELFTTDWPGSTIRDTFGPQMLSTDGETQRRYKNECMPSFTAAAVKESASGLITDRATALIDGFAREGSVDLRASFAGPLALHTVATVLGLPEAMQGAVRIWYEHFTAALANFPGEPEVRRRGIAAAAEFRGEVSTLLETLERQPDASLLSALVHRSRDRLSEEEILSNAMIILFGGIETTESMLSNAVWALLKHPESCEEVRVGPSGLLMAAIEESLRWEPAVQSCTRHATREAEIGGVSIRRGETVQCMLGAANRDPARFPEPDRFDVHRGNASDHLAFGAGRHFCLGAPLARLEATIGLRALLDRLPELRLHPDRPSAPYGYEFRKPPTLDVIWTP